MPGTVCSEQLALSTLEFVFIIVGAMFLIVVAGCVIRGAYDDLIRLINRIQSRRESKREAARMNEVDRQLFAIAKGFHGDIRRFGQTSK
jgi:hypothetical protein